MDDPRPYRSVDIVIHDDAWLKIMTEDAWDALFSRCHHIVNADAGNVSICLSNDEEIAQLNTQYRKKPMPTNVLAFPQDTPDTLGDVMLAYGVIQKEATQQNKAFIDHVTHLFIHGMLHLLGYNHIDPQEATHMESLEIRILATLGVANPYE